MIITTMAMAVVNKTAIDMARGEAVVADLGGGGAVYTHVVLQLESTYDGVRPGHLMMVGTLSRVEQEPPETPGVGQQ